MNIWTIQLRGHGVFKYTDPSRGMGITRDSTVFAAATEMGNLDGAFRPFIGLASIAVLNVAPQDNGNVDFMINVDWGEDLDVRVSLMLI